MHTPFAVRRPAAALLCDIHTLPYAVLNRRPAGAALLLRTMHTFRVLTRLRVVAAPSSGRGEEPLDLTADEARLLEPCPVAGALVDDELTTRDERDSPL